jgi:hypothetical protein
VHHGAPRSGWYCGGAPAATQLSLCDRPELSAAIVQTVFLGVVTVLIATPLGVAFAIGMISGWFGNGALVSTAPPTFERDSNTTVLAPAFAK